MALISKSKKRLFAKTNTTKEVEKKFEDEPDLQKLVLYVVIVNHGHSQNVIKLFKNNHSSAQFIKNGEGTASAQVRDILSIEDNRKEIIYSLICADFVDDFKREIEAYFASSKKNAGVAFTLDVDSIVGVKVYKFLSQTVRG